jgi:hypothetical protein
MKRALCMAIALALMSVAPAFAQCGISQAQGLSPVVSGANIQGCSVGQAINVRTNSQALASSLPPLQLNLPNPQAAPQAAPKAAVQQPAPSESRDEPAEEPAPQESRKRNPNLIDERSLMAFSTPSRGRNVPGKVEHLVDRVSPQQLALTAAMKR